MDILLAQKKGKNQEGESGCLLYLARILGAVTTLIVLLFSAAIFFFTAAVSMLCTRDMPFQCQHIKGNARLLPRNESNLYNSDRRDAFLHSPLSLLYVRFFDRQSSQANSAERGILSLTIAYFTIRQTRGHEHLHNHRFYSNLLPYALYSCTSSSSFSFLPFLVRTPFPSLPSFFLLHLSKTAYHDTENMMRRSPPATSPHRYILLSMLVMVLDSLVSAGARGGPSHTVQIPISTVVAPLDAAAMETLCADQIGMCTVSCQNKIQQNSWYSSIQQQKKKKNVHAPSLTLSCIAALPFPSYLTLLFLLSLFYFLFLFSF